MLKRIALLLVIASAFATAAAQEIRLDGSSTVYPVALAIAEEFGIEFPSARVSVAFSGTGAGFEKFCRGETEMSGASRPIKASEAELCAANGIEFVEIPIAGDALTVIVNANNDFATCMTVDELKRAWEPDSGVTTWADIRPEWPAEEIVFYGAGADSGTFDYFTEAIVGESGAIRTDFFPSEDDNVLVLGVAGNDYAMGFFGFAYFVENRAILNAVEIDGGNGCVEPSAENAASNTYIPLSRPLFEYVNIAKLDANPDLAAFIEFALTSDLARNATEETGYLVYPDAIYAAALERVNDRVPGSVFGDFEPGDSVLDALRQR
ncbi:MAG: PstS family phosphate ABC transporter substrate-binding protein [Trueperaceae bacterium]|nr:PstS family phosphate ABC transporter substrate-binding protein [Trueperaceae bacterium]